MGKSVIVCKGFHRKKHSVGEKCVGVYPALVEDIYSGAHVTRLDYCQTVSSYNTVTQSGNNKRNLHNPIQFESGSLVSGENGNTLIKEY